MDESLGQSGSLDVQDLLAGLGHLVVGRDEGMGVDGTLEQERMFVLGRLAGDNLCVSLALGIDERGIGLTLGAQTFDINLSHLQLWLEREAVALDEETAILENHGIAAIDDILRGFTEAARAIDVATHGTGALLGHQ